MDFVGAGHVPSTCQEGRKINICLLRYETVYTTYRVEKALIK